MKVFTFTPSYSSQVELSQATLISDFGDGYSQRAPRGIHSQRLRFSLAFDQVRSAKAKAVLEFLKGVGGTEPFLWVPPAPWDITSAWVVEMPFAHQIGGYDAETIQVTFQQDFNPAPRVLPAVIAVSGANVLTLTSGTAGATLRYSLDPDATLERISEGLAYLAPTPIPPGSFVRARAFKPSAGLLDSLLSAV